MKENELKQDVVYNHKHFERKFSNKNITDYQYNIYPSLIRTHPRI